jgi:hypothetical protein
MTIGHPLRVFCRQQISHEQEYMLNGLVASELIHGVKGSLKVVAR